MLISGERKESFDLVAGLLLGADDYLLKPFVLDELLARVQRLARRSRPIARTAVAGLTRRELRSSVFSPGAWTTPRSHATW